MTHGLGALTIVLLLGMVLTRVAILRRRGITAVKFCATDKADFLILPFAFLYFYIIFASALDWPTFVHSTMFTSTVAAWVGVALCASGLGLIIVTLIAFGSSFRVGIDMDRPYKLVTTGVFARTRNPIFIAYTMVLAGEFLILPHWLLLVYLLAGVLFLHRQILREEGYLASHYGSEYQAYRKQVPRYL